MTKIRDDQMVLSAFLMPAGYDLHSWQIEGSRAEEFGQLGVLADLARQFEAAKFDSIFIADTLGSDYIRENDMAMGNPYEPLLSLAALIPHTSRIGLIATVSTTFTHPYHTARQLAALDQLSGGRTGWNIVTSSWGERAFGLDAMPPADLRYRRAGEFVNVAKALWSAWSDDAILADRATGRWVDPDKIQPIRHEGEFFKVEGYLNIPPSPQRHTVLVQAGQSAGGLELSSRHAEVNYTVQPEQAPAIKYYAEQKARVAALGRDPAQFKILPGIIPYVGRTEAEAQALFDATVSKMDMENLRRIFEKALKIDLSGLAMNAPVPADRFAAAYEKTGGSRILAYRDYAAQEGGTLRDMLVNHSRAMGHVLAVGTAEQVADIMIDGFEKRACDGFSVNAPSYPGSVDTICNLLMPELRRRGYAREDYAATTLRGNLGLPVPPAWDE